MSNPTTQTKAYKGVAMEGIIATWYARNTNTGRDFPEIAQRVSANIPAGGEVLEVAPGPGFLSIELAKLGFQVSGLDISKTFVEIASENARKEGIVARFRQGNASQLPFEADSFDFIICTAAFKNFTDPVGAMQEMQRVLRPGCKAVIIDLRKDASLSDIDTEIERMQLNPINKWMTRWTFRNMLLKSAYTQAQIESFLAQTRFRKTEVRAAGIGFEIWMEK